MMNWWHNWHNWHKITPGNKFFACKYNKNAFTKEISVSYNISVCQSIVDTIGKLKPIGKIMLYVIF